MRRTYDVVILHGRVMDAETMFDAVRNVGITAGRIFVRDSKARKLMAGQPIRFPEEQRGASIPPAASIGSMPGSMLRKSSGGPETIPGKARNFYSYI